MAENIINYTIENPLKDDDWESRMKPTPESREKRIETLLLCLDKEYDFIGSWVGNGCEHGFKPARDCPNDNCKPAYLHRKWESIFGIKP